MGTITRMCLLVVCAATAQAGAAGAAEASEGRSKTLTGRYVVVHADGKLSGSVRYYLRAAERTYRLRFKRRPSIRPQARVQVAGVVEGASVSVDDIDVTATPAAPDTTGMETLLAIQVRWGSASRQSTKPGAEAFLFGSDQRSVDQWYRKASYGKLGWRGAVTEDIVIPDPHGCDLYGIVTSATGAARESGYDVDAYDRVMINAPAGYCGSAGYGEVGGRFTWLFDGLSNLSDGYQRLVPAHELGHNLGRWHSHGLECGSETISHECLSRGSIDEYGNAYDVMGNNWPGDTAGGVAMFSAKPLIELGWFGGRALEVASSGSYRIAPLELAGAISPQALVIDAGSRRYYVELRRALGVDDFLTAYPEGTNGIQVNMRHDLLGADNGPLNLDFAPGSSTCSYCDFFDSSLDPGQTFDEVGGAFRMTVDAVSDDGATVSVELGDFAPPETSITSGPSGFVASRSATFGFTANEEAVTYDCSLDDAAWSACTSPRSYDALAQGAHTFAVRARDAAGHVDPTPAAHEFTVDTLAPVVKLTAPLAGAVLGGTVALGAAPSDANGTTRVKWFVDGVQVATDTTSDPWEKSWDSTTVPQGTHKIVVKARDPAGNWGASRSATVTTAG